MAVNPLSIVSLVISLLGERVLVTPIAGAGFRDLESDILHC